MGCTDKRERMKKYESLSKNMLEINRIMFLYFLSAIKYKLSTIGKKMKRNMEELNTISYPFFIKWVSVAKSNIALSPSLLP